MSSYSCLSCRVAFVDSELQRSHYKTNWHRYNLKRKVAELPPVTREVFEQKLAQQKSDAEEQQRSTAQFCEACNKTFSNENAYQNHVNSKKHKLIEGRCNTGRPAETEGSMGRQTRPLERKTKKKQEIKTKNVPLEDDIGMERSSDEDYDVDDDDDEWEDVDEDEEIDQETEAIPPTKCLFCPHESISLEDNLRHMTKSHSFFIPDIDYLTELENFIIYLGAKVGDGKICLTCNRKSRVFYTVEAVQKHMRDKGHCTIDYEGDNALEYSEFYDFSSSYPDFDPNSRQDDDDNSDEEEETVEGNLQVDENTLELILPSGARAGHRAFKHIYKQDLPPAHLQNRERAMIKGLNAEYKALGWHGSVPEAMKKNMITQKMKSQHDKHARLKLAMKANKMQPHLRPQVIF